MARVRASRRIWARRSAALRSFQPSIQFPARGSTSPTIRDMMMSTTMSSSNVTPASSRADPVELSPTLDVRILSVSAWLAVRPEADDVWLVAVIPRKLVDVGAAPGVEGDLLGEIRPIPVVDPRRSHPQGRQALVGGREGTRVELVRPERGLKSRDLGLGRHHLG